MLDRTVVPKSHPPEFTELVSPVSYKLENDINVFHFNGGSQKVFKVELMISAGSAHNINPALAPLCVAVLREGTAKQTAKALNYSLDYFGAFLDLKSGLDNSLIGLYGRSIFIKELISLLAEILLEPVFNLSAIEKHKSRMIQELHIEQMKTSYWAPRLLRKNIFGEKHPYGNLITEVDIKAISREDLINYHKKVILPGLQSIIIVGSYIEHDVDQMLKDCFSFPIQNHSNFTLPYPDPEDVKEITKNLSNIKQASIILGKKTIGISESNYPTSALFSKILGGYFGSRLMKKLREEEGLTYGIHAYNIHISADVEMSSVDKSIKFIMAEIELLQNLPVPKNELETVKNFMIGEFIAASNTVFDFADLYKKILLQNLPSDYYNDYYSKLSFVNAEEIQSYSNKLLNISEITIVKVG